MLLHLASSDVYDKGFKGRSDKICNEKYMLKRLGEPEILQLAYF